MGVVAGLPGSAGSGQTLGSSPGRGAPCGLPRYRGRGNGLPDAGRECWRCIVAAGVAVAVVLCMSWAHAARIRPGFAGLDNHMIGTAARLGTAGTDSGRCTAGSALASVRLPGRDPLWRGPGDRRQQRVRVVLAADVRPGQSITDSPDSGQAPGGTAGMRTTGRPATVAIADVGCRFAGRWFRAGQYFTPFRLPFGIGRHRIQVLAFGGWSAEGPTRPEQGGCAADEIAELVQRLDAAVLDSGNGGIVLSPRSDPGSRLNPQGDQVPEASGGNPALICVKIGTNRHGTGVSSPGRWCGTYGASGGQVGSGDRASLPGRSTRYRVIWLVCPQCGTKMACLFYDEGDRPVCENSPHGRMEVQR